MFQNLDQNRYLSTGLLRQGYELNRRSTIQFTIFRISWWQKFRDEGVNSVPNQVSHRVHPVFYEVVGCRWLRPGFHVAILNAVYTIGPGPKGMVWLEHMERNGDCQLKMERFAIASLFHNIIIPYYRRITTIVRSDTVMRNLYSRGRSLYCNLIVRRIYSV